MEKIYEIYIRATPEQVWDAITDIQARNQWQPGYDPSGNAPGLEAIGKDIEADPPRRLVQTMHAKWNDEVEAEGETRITWEIVQIEDSCHLIVTHDQMRENANNQIYGGWPMILSMLKTHLEGGGLLTTPYTQIYGPQAAK